MLVVAVEDFKLQNRHMINKLLTPRGQKPRCQQGVNAIPSPKLLGEVTNWQHIHRSYSINHTFGLRLPPPYSTLQPRDSCRECRGREWRRVAVSDKKEAA